MPLLHVWGEDRHNSSSRKRECFDTTKYGGVLPNPGAGSGGGGRASRGHTTLNRETASNPAVTIAAVQSPRYRCTCINKSPQQIQSIHIDTLKPVAIPFYSQKTTHSGGSNDQKSPPLHVPINVHVRYRSFERNNSHRHVDTHRYITPATRTFKGQRNEGRDEILSIADETRSPLLGVQRTQGNQHRQEGHFRA